MHKLIMKLLFFGLFIGAPAAVAQTIERPDSSAVGKWRLPDRPIGQRASAILDFFESGKDAQITAFIQENLAPGFRDDYPMSEHVAWFRQRQSDLQGNFRTGGIFMLPNRAEISLRANRAGTLYTLILEVQDEQPHLITGLGFESATPSGSEFADADISDVEAITDFDQFKAIFNSDSGHVRLITILSPT